MTFFWNIIAVIEIDKKKLEMYQIMRRLIQTYHLPNEDLNSRFRNALN